MDRWEEIHTTHNLSLLFIKKTNCPNNEFLELLWVKIYNEYLKEFGLTSEYKNIKKIERKIAMLKADFIITGRRTILNFINIEEIALKAIKTDLKTGSSLRKNIMHIEKMQGVPKSAKTITVSDYFHYLKSNND